MKDEKKKRKVLPVDKEKKQKKIKKIDPQHEQEQQQLFTKADAISPANKKSQKELDIELRGGTAINIDEYVRENYVEKATHFFRDTFYFPIADLLGISRDYMRTFVKPLIVPMLKRVLIYGRFPNAIQRKIYKKNPYTGYCTRSYWNYQFLTIKADDQLRGFINDFETELTEVLKANGDIKKFITQYCEKFHIPIQLNLFEGK